MALPKRHWGNAAQTPGFIPSAACGRDSASFEREVIVTSATSFNGSAAKNPDWYCKDCAKAARLALAAESAPKPDARTDSDRYAELRKLVEAWQSHTVGSSQTLADWRHR